ncbi:MAG: condensation domain-containing protein, partial [Ferrovibrionaceae bacterium]
MTEHAREMLQIARRYAALAQDKRAAFRARLIEAGIAAERLPIVPLTGRPARLALSPAQERLWFLWRLAPDDTAYVIAGAVRLTGPLDVARLRRALTGVVARHEALRTRFVEHDGTPWQVIAEDAEYGWSEAGDLAVRPFDLERGPLLRAALSRVGPDRHDLLLSMHHIVADGWSIAILLREVSALYAGEDLPPLPIQYGDYALWQREWLDERRLDRQLAYWRDRLGTEHPELRLPTRSNRAGGPVARAKVVVPAALTAGLRR